MSKNFFKTNRKLSVSLYFSNSKDYNRLGQHTFYKMVVYSTHYILSQQILYTNWGYVSPTLNKGLTTYIIAIKFRCGYVIANISLTGTKNSVPWVLPTIVTHRRYWVIIMKMRMKFECFTSILAVWYKDLSMHKLLQNKHEAWVYLYF